MEGTREDVSTGDLGQSQELMRSDVPQDNPDSIEALHVRRHAHDESPPMAHRHPLDGQQGMGLWRTPPQQTP